MTATLVLLMAAAYLLGSLPSGLVVCRSFKAPDPREGGSGSLGATNVARMAGIAAGVITLLIDVAKGAAPVWFGLSMLEPWQAALLGLASFLGHIWPVYLRFKGGKGVATCMGVVLAFCPLALLGMLAVFLAAYLPFRFVSVGSMSASVSASAWLAIFGAPGAVIFCTSVMALLILWKHRGNINRLKKGEEHRLRM